MSARLLTVAFLLQLLTHPAAAPVPHPRAQPHAWRPAVVSARRFAAHRRGVVAFGVATRDHFWGFRERQSFGSLSLVKAMLMVAYLRRDPSEPLEPYERALLDAMVRSSDNKAATAVLGAVGTAGLYEIAHRAGMRNFSAVPGVWFLTRVDARDQARFFLRIDRFVPRRHRAYAMHLLGAVVPYQRWGIAELRPRRWRLYFKGGWGPEEGWVDNQAALLIRGHQRVAVAILTRLNGNHGYAAATLRGVAGRLLHGLARSRSVR
jgi:beta-lactamase family protein